MKLNIKLISECSGLFIKYILFFQDFIINLSLGQSKFLIKKQNKLNINLKVEFMLKFKII